MENFKIIYYESEKGDCPILDFIDSRDIRNQAKIMAYLEILEKNGPLLPRPYADILTDGIHELRVKLSGEQIRILYFFVYKEFIVLTHSFRKNSNKVPTSEIEKAKKFRTDFLKRYSETALRRKLKDENI